MKHKHCELIKAWADGAKIQIRDVDGKWVDVNPNWSTHYTYRIKPSLSYRVALMEWCNNGFYTQTQNNTATVNLEDHPYFIRWLTDWVEVEL